MEQKDPRVEKLRELVVRAGGPAKFARTHPGVDPTYVSQILNGHRSFRERAARKMEKLCELPEGYFEPSSDAIWPFKSIDYSRYLALSHDERIRLEGVVEGALAAIEIEKRAAGRTLHPRGTAAR